LSAPLSGEYTIGGDFIWERQSVTGTAPANTTTVGVQVLRRGVVGAANFYVDAIMIEQASTVLPYFDGTYVNAYTGYGLDSKGWNGTANASSSTASWFVGNSRTNLTKNPSFETNTTGWNPNGSTISRVAATWGTGNNALQIVHTATTLGGTFSDFGSFNVTAGLQYTASFYARSISGTLRGLQIAIVWYNAAGTQISTSTANQVLTTSTQRWSVTATAPAGSAIALMYAYTYTTGVIGDIWQMDSVLFEQASSVLPYFDGTYVNDYSGYGLYSKAWNGTANASTSTANWYVGNTRTNYVANPNFEVDTTGWIAAAVTLTRITSASYVGTACLQMSSPTAGDVTARTAYEPNTPISAGVVVTASAYVYNFAGNDRQHQIQIRCFNSAGSVIVGLSGDLTTVNVGSGWTRLTVTGTTPALTDNIDIVVFCQANNTSLSNVTYVDAIMVEQASSALPYFDGTYADTYTGYTLESQAWNGTANASTSTAVWGLSSSYVGTPMDSDYALS
jgi:hypothetical protein